MKAQANISSKFPLGWMSMTNNKDCPDCKGNLTKIKLIGGSWENPISGVAVHTELKFFTDADAKRSYWSAMFTPTGEIETYICNSCSRIFLYGIPKTSK